jgi:hypothetical protein
MHAQLASMLEFEHQQLEDSHPRTNKQLQQAALQDW